MKVSAAAEEAAEEVEGVVVLSRRAALLVLFYTFMAILVIYTARFFVDKNLVGFGDGNELLVCAFIATTAC